MSHNAEPYEETIEKMGRTLQEAMQMLMDRAKARSSSGVSMNSTSTVEAHSSARPDADATSETRRKPAGQRSTENNSEVEVQEKRT